MSLFQQIKDEIIKIGYHQEFADRFVKIIEKWRNKNTHSIKSLKHKLDKTKSDYRNDRLSEEELSNEEINISKQLSYLIMGEIRPKDSVFDLEYVIQYNQANCFGFTQLFYIMGNSIGLSVKAIGIEALLLDEKNGDIEGHNACIVKLKNNNIIIVDLMNRVITNQFIHDIADVGLKFKELFESIKPVNYKTLIPIIHELDRKKILSYIYKNNSIKYFVNKDYNEAISICTRAIEYMPSNEMAYFNRGIYYDSMNLYEEAIHDFSETIRYAPQLAMAYYNRGVCYFEIKKYQQTIEDLTEAINIESRLANAYYNRGLAYTKLFDKAKKAKKDLKKAVRLNPSLESQAKAVFKQYGWRWCQIFQIKKDS